MDGKTCLEAEVKQLKQLKAEVRKHLFWQKFFFLLSHHFFNVLSSEESDELTSAEFDRCRLLKRSSGN